MILYLVSLLIFLFAWCSLFLGTRCGTGAKITGGAVLFLISMKYALYQLLGGAFFAPRLPLPVKLAMEALYNALIVLVFLLLAKDIFRLALFLLSRLGVISAKRRFPGALDAGLVLLACGLGAWGVWQAVRVPDVRTVTLELPRLPRALDGFSLVQLSDLHIGPLLKGDWLEKVVDRTNAANPDLILLTGDYVDGTVEEIGPELAPLAGLRARYGVFGVTGNHEYYWDAAGWKTALEKLGVVMLENDRRTLAVNGETLVVAGLPDIVAARFNQPAPDIRAALADAPAGTRILLAHQPRPAREYAPFADLHLAGHTHGGLLFFLQPLIALFNGGYVNGEYAIGDERLYVSPGTALWSGFSCRIGVPAEITRIILKAP